MIELTRRALLAGSAAMAAAGMVSFRARAAARTYRALLVACTDYDNLPKKNWLIGPKHDAGLVRDYLLDNVPAPVKFEPADVTLLAKDVDGANGLPTHAAITAAFADLAAKAERDDFIYLHLSGHGAQQPERVAGDETDGLDEIFLPMDIQKWVDRAAGVPNALVDDEIRAALDAIRDKGAFVWAVFDCCHSGTATRAVLVDDELERKVEFADLVGGDDAQRAAALTAYDDTVAAATRALDESGPRKGGFNLKPTGAEPIAKGKMVAFYAAQTVETTPEMPLPKGVEGATRFGLFTFTIMAKLAENPNVTYRQLGQAVLQQYAADGRTRPTPLFEGELDAPVFGTDKTDAALQWPLLVKSGAATIKGGLLHRLTPGSKLAVLPSALSPVADAVGYVEVVSARNLESTVRPVAFDGKPALALADIPANAYARVAELTVDYKLVVARPPAGNGLDAETALVDSVLDELAAARESGFNITLVDPGRSADLRLAVLRENAVAGAAAPDADNNATDRPALWFLPASGDVATSSGARPPLVVIHPDDRMKLLEATGKNLVTIFRATGLSRLAAASDYRPEEVSVVFAIKRDGSGALEPLEASSVPRVSPGDQVHVKAVNHSANLVDINVLYVGSDYSITHIVSERLASEATLEEALLAFTDTSFGMERMIAVLTEAPPQSEKEDLSFLAQEGVPAATRGAGPAGFSDMLADIGMAPATRSVMKLSDSKGPRGAVMIFPVETVPRA